MTAAAPAPHAAAAAHDWVADRSFRAMGCDVRLYAEAAPGAAAALAARVDRAQLLVQSADALLTRFDDRSELSRLNADPRTVVPGSPLLVLAAQVALRAARASAGLLDPTLTGALGRAGYAGDWDPARRAPLDALLAAAPPRKPAKPAAARDWAQIVADRKAGTIARPPGVTLDLGASAKGLIADLALRMLGPAVRAFVDVGGDLAFAGGEQPLLAADPFGRAPHALRTCGPSGVATSSIAGRCWIGDEGPAHHLLDPSSGRPAFTGVVQATACAPSAAEAERLAGQALLSGPGPGAALLRQHGGLLILDDTTTIRVAAQGTR